MIIPSFSSLALITILALSESLDDKYTLKRMTSDVGDSMKHVTLIINIIEMQLYLFAFLCVWLVAITIIRFIIFETEIQFLI
jgi:hypothetical protein